MADEITVSAPEQQVTKRKPPGLSPLQTALLYGGAATTVMGPLGLIIGAGYGLLNKRLRDDWLDKETRFTEQTHTEHQNLLEQIRTEMQNADPDEQRLLRHAQRMASDGYYRLMNGDPTGSELIQKANTISEGIINADSQARKQDEAAAINVQRGLITTAANSYRSEFQTNMQQFEQMDQQTARIFDLVSQPDFDPNKPSNKAVLAELLSTGIGGFYKDAPDVLDAVAQGSSVLEKIPVVGQYGPDLIGAITTAIKAKDFQMTREDYNRLALNMKAYARSHAEGKMQQLAEQAKQLDTFAKRTRTIPEDYSLGDYISGGIKELKFIPSPQYTPPAKPQRTTAPNNTGGGFTQWMLQQQNRSPLRPTN